MFHLSYEKLLAVGVMLFLVHEEKDRATHEQFSGKQFGKELQGACNYIQ